MRVLAVDHGEKRIGLAISDPTGTLPRPLVVLQHRSRVEDAERVNQTASEQGAELIVVGESFDEEGRPNAAGRRAERFAEELRRHTTLQVVLWDESLSTQDAQAARLASGRRKKKRSAPVDADAAAVLLESYLEAQRAGTTDPDAMRRGEG